MEIRIERKLALLLMLTLGCSACQPLVLRPEPVAEASPAEQPPAEEVTPPEPPGPPDDLPASQRVKRALQMLAEGDYGNARNQLEWARADKPGLQIADNLIQQLDADPVEFLGMKNFYYTVASGDSLSIIAGKFLDDPMKFVILARYNQLENPSKLAPGDRIRVPGVMPEETWRKPRRRSARRSASSTPPRAATVAATPVANPAATPRTEPEDPATQQTAPAEPATPSAPSLGQVLDAARKRRAGGDLPGAIEELEVEGARFAHEKSMQTLQIEYYRAYADQLVEQGEWIQARGTLEKVVLLDASDEQAINRLIQVEDKLEADKLYRLGEDLLANGQTEAAYEKLSQALTYAPDHAAAKAAQIRCRDLLTDDYHRQAMRHFRQQELDEAIALWERILSLDPAHPLAAGYKARAVEMKQKLQRIEETPQ